MNEITAQSALTLVEARNEVLKALYCTYATFNDGFMDLVQNGEKGYGSYWGTEVRRPLKGKHGRTLTVRVFVPMDDAAHARVEIIAENGERWEYSEVPAGVLQRWYAGARNWFEV